MDLHYKQEVTVGALVLGAIGLFVAGTMWLSGQSLGGGDNVVEVEFADVGNLKRGNPVRVSGVQLGTVGAIRFEDVGRVVVTLELDERIVPKTDATATMASVGLVGDVIIRFNPGRAPDPLRPGQRIIGTEEAGLAAMGEDLSGQASNLLAGLEAVEYARLSRELEATLASIRRLSDLFAGRETGPTAEMVATMKSLQQLTLRLDSVVAAPGLGQAVTNLDTVAVRLGRMTDEYTRVGARIDSLLTGMQRGDGTLGRMATDSTLYTELTALSTSLKSFIDDLRRNPGKITVQVKIF